MNFKSRELWNNFTCWSSNGWVTCESHSLTSVSGWIPNLNPNGSRLKKCLIKKSLTCVKSSDLRVSKTKDIMNAVVIWRNFLHFFYYCCGEQLSLDFVVLEWAWCSCSRFLASVLSSRTNVTSVVGLECYNCGVYRKNPPEKCVKLSTTFIMSSVFETLKSDNLMKVNDILIKHNFLLVCFLLARM